MGRWNGKLHWLREAPSVLSLRRMSRRKGHYGQRLQSAGAAADPPSLRTTQSEAHRHLWNPANLGGRPCDRHLPLRLFEAGSGADGGMGLNQSITSLSQNTTAYCTLTR